MNINRCLFILLLIICISPIGCSEQSKYYAQKKGMFAYLIVDHYEDGILNPINYYTRYPKKVDDIFSNGMVITEGEDKDILELFKIKRGPYFIIFDTNGVIFRTDDPKLARKFINKKVVDKISNMKE
ncbi:MAG TPA: hypothetical protein VFK44_03385 [Bacillales bacterium]|nr:hypothetical protein [Bacillales bacterium]